MPLANPSLIKAPRAPFSKPHPGVGINWRHPFAKYLVHSYPFNEGRGELAKNYCWPRGEFDLRVSTPTGAVAPGVSRTWNGSASNYLDVALGTVTGLNAMCAWVKVNSLGVLGTIYGNRFDAGYAFQINASNQLQISFTESAVTYNLTAPLTIAGGASKDYLQVGQPLFVAANITHSQAGSPPVSADFYAGQTPSTVEFIGSDSDGTFTATNGTQHVLIGANNNGAVQDVLSGSLQRVGRWTGVNLSLAEFKAVAVCGASIPQSANCSMFYRMTGASPEPTSFGGVDATIVGSLPTGPDLCIPPNTDSPWGVFAGVPGLKCNIDQVPMLTHYKNTGTTNANTTGHKLLPAIDFSKGFTVHLWMRPTESLVGVVTAYNLFNIGPINEGTVCTMMIHLTRFAASGTDWWRRNITVYSDGAASTNLTNSDQVWEAFFDGSRVKIDTLPYQHVISVIANSPTPEVRWYSSDGYNFGFSGIGNITPPDNNQYWPLLSVSGQPPFEGNLWAWNVYNRAMGFQSAMELMTSPLQMYQPEPSNGQVVADFIGGGGSDPGPGEDGGGLVGDVDICSML